ncbi:hypothetical protein LINPERPRIM_LOCUS9708 [Linum perenne]
MHFGGKESYLHLPPSAHKPIDVRFTVRSSSNNKRLIMEAELKANINI